MHRCPKCGTVRDLDFLTDSFMYIDESDRASIAGLLDGLFDTISCGTCRTALDIHFTTVVMFDRKRLMYFVMGTLAQSKRDALLWTDWRKQFPEEADLVPRLIECPSMEMLRQAVAAELARRRKRSSGQ